MGCPDKDIMCLIHRLVPDLVLGLTPSKQSIILLVVTELIIRIIHISILFREVTYYLMNFSSGQFLLQGNYFKLSFDKDCINSLC